MSEPFVTVLQEIADAPDTFSPYVVASWCGKASKHIEQQQAEIERLQKGWESLEWESKQEIERLRAHIERNEELQAVAKEEPK